MERPVSLKRSAGSLLSRCKIVGMSSCGGQSASLLLDRPRCPCWPSTGSKPRLSRSRTSRTVPGEIPALLATARSDAVGSPLRRSAASLRPSELLSGRTRPSYPLLARNWAFSPVAHCGLVRIVAIVLWDNPMIDAMRRSDQSGCTSTMRAAAAFRSARDSGSPCIIFSWTDIIKISSSSPSKN